MVVDFTVMVLTIIGLRREGFLRSRLHTLVLRHGIIYFFVSFVANLVPVVRASLTPSNVTLIVIIEGVHLVKG